VTTGWTRQLKVARDLARPTPRSVANTRSIAIVDDANLAGETTRAFYSRHIDDVLVAYLELVRELRRSPETTVLLFRRVDVEVLATFLECSGETVLDELAVLMGANRMRAATMTARFGAGDQVIDSGLTDLVAADLLDEVLPSHARALIAAAGQRAVPGR